MGYPASKRRRWLVQVEFLDGTTIDANTDSEIMERWRRLAAWSDPTAETHPVAWQERILARARVFYQANLDGLTGESDATAVLDGLAAERCLSLRRKT